VSRSCEQCNEPLCCIIGGESLISWGNICFSIMTLLYGMLDFDGVENDK
jgi:hypothetical protein